MAYYHLDHHGPFIGIVSIDHRFNFYLHVMMFEVANHSFPDNLPCLGYNSDSINRIIDVYVHICIIDYAVCFDMAMHMQRLSLLIIALTLSARK